MARLLSFNSFFVSLVFLFCICFFLIGDYDYSESILLFFLILNTLIIVCFFSYNKRQLVPSKDQYLKISSFFLIGFYIVHYQMYIDYVLGNYKNFGHDYIYDENFILKAISVSSIALCSFVLGYRYKIVKVLKGINRTSKSDAFKDYNLKRALKFITTLLYFFVLLLIFTVDSSYCNGGYGRDGVEIGGIGGYINDYIIIFFITYLVLWLLEKGIRKQKFNSFLSFVKSIGLPYLCILFIFCVLTLMSGDRGPVMQVVLAFFGCFVLVYKYRIKIGVFLMLLVVGVITFSFVAYVRENKDVTSYSQKIIAAQKNQLESSKNYSFSPTTYELATSVRTLQACMIYTEENDFSYGVFQGMQVLNIIPGLGSIIGAIIGIDVSTLNSAEFLTYQILGQFPSHGLGTSATADVYLDFGLIGIIFLFTFFGIVVCDVEQNVFKNNVNSIYYYAFFLVLLSFSIYISRSSILSVFRVCFLVYLFSSIFIFLFKKKG